jgi:hypothetical protein
MAASSSLRAGGGNHDGSEIADQSSKLLAATMTTTLQALSHVISGKAHKEPEMAERARANNWQEEAIKLTIPQLERAIKVDPYRAALFVNLSTGRMLLRRLEEAERADQKSRLFGFRSLQVMRVHPFHPLIAQIYVARNNPTLAKAEVQKYLSSRPQRWFPIDRPERQADEHFYF